MDLISIRYKLKNDVYGRIATNLVYALNELKGSVFIIQNEKVINGKSLVGVLSLGMKFETPIEIRITNSEDEIKLREIFSNIADEIKEG